MLLLVTGASGAGKSTARAVVAPALAPEIECVKLGEVAPQGLPWSLEWRQRGAEAAVLRAVELQRAGRHLLLAGDPVAAVEIAAAPSAPTLEGFAFCLLDIGSDAQATRLGSRGDPDDLLPHHQAFAAWMRAQAGDPRHMLEVVSNHAWPEMRWDRIPELAGSWAGHVVDVSAMSRTEVGEAVMEWARRVLSGDAPTIRFAGQPERR